MRLRPEKTPAAIVTTTALALLAAVGCEEERHVGSPAGSKAKNAVAHGAAPPERKFIVGEKTQHIVNAAPEIAKGAKVSDNKITATDYITLQGNAYVSIIGQTSVMMIDHAMDLYRAEHDRYPKDLDEFMTDIIKANNIALPELPYYQKYGYDEKEHKLKVLEYEDLKNQPQGQ
jgi:hypothetical protein